MSSKITIACFVPPNRPVYLSNVAKVNIINVSPDKIERYVFQRMFEVSDPKKNICSAYFENI